MRSTDIDHYLGTSPSSGAAKLAEIRKMLKMYQLDPNWTLPVLGYRLALSKNRG
jgi:hypothetical protein